MKLHEITKYRKIQKEVPKTDFRETSTFNDPMNEGKLAKET